jgi:uncharacterized protein involved in exopolysaccharide biosynthesis
VHRVSSLREDRLDRRRWENAPELRSPAAPTATDWCVLALGGIRRRRLLALSVFVVVLAATALQYWRQSESPLYRVQARLLAQRAQALPSAVRPVFDDAPTRSAADIIHRREHLVAIVRQANLVSDPVVSPAPPTGWIGRLLEMGRSRGDDSPADPVDKLVAVLHKHLLVTSVEGTITIQLDWPDPQQGHAIVQSALDNFLDARHAQEVGALEDVITVLEDRVAVLQQSYEEARARAVRRPVQAPRPALPRVRQPSEELVGLKAALDSKQRALQDLDEFRRRRLADLQAQLDQARSVLSEAHPTIVGLRQDVAALSQEPPQVRALREEEGELRRQLAQRLAREGINVPDDFSRSLVDVGGPVRLEEDQDVREARLQYENIVARLNGALVERDAARAAFKYRYSVIWPPQVPTEPIHASPKKLFVIGGFAALVLALLAAVLPDLVRGRIVERWQVERSLGLPVVGEIRRR